MSAETRRGKTRSEAFHVGTALASILPKGGSMGKLSGKVAIITGGAGGIGQASATLFVREGARVMLVDRDESTLRAACERIGSECEFAVADVADEGDTRRYVEATLAKHGGIDVLFANAGIEGRAAPLCDTAASDFDHVIAVNVRGAFLAIREAAPHITRRGGGAIIVTSSVAGLVGSHPVTAAM
jgi:3alpha(or 20beta)-hydroxysteroid dehydrogenase